MVRVDGLHVVGELHERPREQRGHLQHRQQLAAPFLLRLRERAVELRGHRLQHLDLIELQPLLSRLDLLELLGNTGLELRDGVVRIHAGIVHLEAADHIDGPRPALCVTAADVLQHLVVVEHPLQLHSLDNQVLNVVSIVAGLAVMLGSRQVEKVPRELAARPSSHDDAVDLIAAVARRPNLIVIIIRPLRRHVILPIDEAIVVEVKRPNELPAAGRHRHGMTQRLTVVDFEGPIALSALCANVNRVLRQVLQRQAMTPPLPRQHRREARAFRIVLQREHLLVAVLQLRLQGLLGGGGHLQSRALGGVFKLLALLGLRVLDDRLHPSFGGDVARRDGLRQRGQGNLLLLWAALVVLGLLADELHAPQGIDVRPQKNRRGVSFRDPLDLVHLVRAHGIRVHADRQERVGEQ
mmetsp:Transcript_109156/g.307773  ORF Transcript_109156/g.307773 Transcript_109156/m.307773 type:complete len:410 (-) Transcript_109156:1697-2926(-)